MNASPQIAAADSSVFAAGAKIVMRMGAPVRRVTEPMPTAPTPDTDLRRPGEPCRPSG
jgi:hypothetical protein